MVLVLGVNFVKLMTVMSMIESAGSFMWCGKTEGSGGREIDASMKVDE